MIFCEKEELSSKPFGKIVKNVKDGSNTCTTG